MHYGALTYEEIRGKSTAGWLALVPTGCTEQQGPHLPVDVVLVDGKIVGVWEHTLKRNQVEVTVALFGEVPAMVRTAIAREAEALGHFLGSAVQLKIAV